MFFPANLEKFDLLYFDLHGEPGSDKWAGSNGLFAITAAQIRSADLSRAVVFAASCYLGDGGPMLSALLDSGAKCVIAGAGKNYSPAHGASYGDALLGLWFRRSLQAGLTPAAALGVAKARVQADMVYRRMAHQTDLENADSDALQFRLYQR